MSRALLVLIAVLALAGAALWFTAHAPAARGPRAPEAAAPAAHVEEEDHALEPAPASTPETVQPEDHAAPPAPTAQREAAAPKDAELARAQWLDGRVLFPAGTPDDEEVFVTADGRDFEDGSDQRVKVERDGSFRVAFSEKTRAGHFELAAHYLYLDESVRWKSKESDGTVVLEPKLGGRIAGHVRVPEGADAARVDGKIGLEVENQAGDAFYSEMVAVHELGRELDFAFDALIPGKKPGRSYELSYDGGTFLGKSQKLVPEAGKTLAVELELRPGVTIAGIARDESGAPLAEVAMSVMVELGNGLWSSSNRREGKSAGDGSFRIGPLEHGKVQLQARLAGYEPLERELGKLAEGESVRDLELVLTRGNSISGLVRWPDGAPAEAFLVLVPFPAGWNSQDEVSGKSDANGAFAISGLSKESYRVKARATKTEEVLEKSAITGKERPTKKRSEWSAEVEQVKVGTSALVLTLSTGLAVEGRVVDDLGNPLEDFILQVDRVGSDRRRFSNSGERSRAFRDTDGSFRFDGFAPGEWDLWGRTRHHTDSEHVRVTLPGAGPVVLVVPREAVVSGRVVDPSGAPMAEASVQADEEGERSPFLRMDDDETADESGLFEISGLGPGKVVVQAFAASFAPSAPETVELRAGETRAGLVLRLRPGGTIIGELVGPDGGGRAGRVSVNSGEHFRASPEADADGHFQVHGVPAGEIQLWTQTEEEIQILESVTVSEGETVHVRLAPPGKLVRLHGHVSAGGEAVVGAQLWASQAGFGEDSRGSSSASETEADGAYEIQLPGQGRYSLAISDQADRELSWRVTLEVPDVQAFEFDVAIPVGRISGRVKDAAGHALAGVTVQSEPEQHEGEAHGSARAVTDAEGRYELLVPVGQHAVRAGGGRDWWSQGQGESKPYAEARVGGLSVSANGHVRGIDLVLAQGGILEGLVRKSDGSGVWVRLWSEEDGEALGWSDERGCFEIRGVAPGVHLVGARGEGVATREPVKVEIAAGETKHVELELVEARVVLLKVREKGLPVGSDVTVSDASGRMQPVQSVENGEVRVGPVVPGRYVVRARRDGRMVERELEVVSGKEKVEIEVEIVFE